MSESGMEDEEEAPDVLCDLENVQGLVDALTAVRWKRQQDAVLELSEHGMVLIVEENGCLQAKLYLKKEVPISSIRDPTSTRDMVKMCIQVITTLHL